MDDHAECEGRNDSADEKHVENLIDLVCLMQVTSLDVKERRNKCNYLNECEK